MGDRVGYGVGPVGDAVGWGTVGALVGAPVGAWDGMGVVGDVVGWAVVGEDVG